MTDYWDSQMKFSEILPDYQKMLDQMAADSASVVPHDRFQRAAYGDHPRQWVEWKEGEGPNSILPVIIHGGYWRALDAANHRFMMPSFEAHGANVDNVEYRLIPEVRLADVVEDVRKALTLLVAQFPSAALLVVGHSAGAHLALSAMSDPNLARRTKGIISLSGVYDLAPVALCFVQEELHLTDEEITSFSLSPSDRRPPVLYVNGSAETHEYLRGGSLMAQLGASRWMILEGANHLSLTWAACEQADALVTSLFELEIHA